MGSVRRCRSAWWMLVLSAALLSPSLARADEPTPAAVERPTDGAAREISIVPEALAQAWRDGDWERARELIPERPMSSRASHRRILEAALVLRVPADSVIAIDSGEVADALEEIEEIEEQRTVAQVMGVVGGIVMTVGIGLALTSNFLFDEGIIRGITGWAVCGVGVLAALVATVFQIDVPFRWQRWAASLGAH